LLHYLVAAVLVFLLSSLWALGGQGFASYLSPVWWAVQSEPGAGSERAGGTWPPRHHSMVMAHWARPARASEGPCGCYSGWCALENLVLFLGKRRSLWNFYAEKKLGFAARCKRDGLADHSVSHGSSLFSAFLKQISLLWRGRGTGQAAWHDLREEYFCWCLSLASQPRDAQRLEGFWPGGVEGARVQGKEFPMSVIGFVMLFTFAKW